MTYAPTSGVMEADLTVEVAMQHSNYLPKNTAEVDGNRSGVLRNSAGGSPDTNGRGGLPGSPDAATDLSPRQRGVCDTMFVGLVFCTLLHANEARAGEQAPLSGSAAHPDFGVRRPLPLSASMVSIPERFQAGTLSEPNAFSSEEFRPRAHSTPYQAPAPPIAPVNEEPMGGTVFQRFADFRSRNQVRLVTLWEAGRSSLSLQAGRKGSPSLQWTSRLMNRGGAPRGVLDELFPVSLGSALSRGLQRASHGSSIDIAARPAKSGDIGAGPIR